MKDLLVHFVHLLTVIDNLPEPVGMRAIVTDSFLMQHRRI
jgi:hypothetical protein